jgi:hypothetical protein
MRNTLLLLFILASLAASAQVKRIALKGGANRPFINDVTNTYTVTTGVPSGTNLGGLGSISQTSATYTERYEEKTGADILGSIDYTLWRKFFVGTGLGLNYIRFKRNGTVMSLDNFIRGYNSPYPTTTGVPIGSLYGSGTYQPRFIIPPTYSDNPGKTDLIYVQVPLMAGVSLLKDRLTVRAGATLSGLVYASEYKLRYDASDNLYHDHRDTSKENFNRLLAGVALNVTYYVFPGLGIDIAANKSLTSIYDLDDDGTDKAKTTLLSLGLCYAIVK